MRKILFPFVALLIQLQSVQSQVTPKDSLTNLEEVILVDELNQKQATGITVSSIIGSQTFENFGPLDLTTAINQVAGVYILSGALNTNRITIRGVGARTPFGTDKLRLYYNNIPVTNGTGFSTIESFDLENLGGVEVIKGPKGTAFGANLGGAILLRSKSSSLESTQLSNSFTVGSYNLIKDNLAFEHQEENFSFQMRYNFLETDGYRQNNRFQRNGVLLNSAYEFNDNNKISLLLNYIDYEAEIPSSLSRTAIDEDPTQAAANWLAAQGFEANKYTLLGLSYHHRFSSRLENTTGIFYTYLDHYEPRPFNILDEFTNGYGFRSVFSGNFGAKEKDITYTLGAELYKDEYNWGTFENLFRENDGNGSLLGDQISDNREFRRQFSAFGSISFPFTDQFIVQAGLNLNKTHYDFRDLFNTGSLNRNAKRNFDAIFLPSLDLTYDLAGGHTIFANISRGFSNPSLEETLTPDGVINPDIEQETGTNYELGTNLLLAKGKLILNLSIYRMDVKNLLVAQRTGEDQFLGKNAGKTKHQGVEFYGEHTINLSTKLKVRPFASYTYNDHSFVDFVDGDNDFSGNPLTGVPKHQVNAGVQINHLGGIFWNTTYQYIDRIPLTDSNTLYSNAFRLFNTKLGYNKKISESFSVALHLGINNLFNTSYTRSVLINAVGFGGSEPRYFYPGDARNYYTSVQFRYFL